MPALVAVALTAMLARPHLATLARPPLAARAGARCARVQLAAEGASGAGTGERKRSTRQPRSLRRRLARWAMPLGRPPRAPAWAPDWSVRLRPSLQLCVLLSFYAGHLLLCTLLSSGTFSHPSATALLLILSLDSTTGCCLLLGLGGLLFLRRPRMSPAAREAAASPADGAPADGAGGAEPLPWKVPPHTRQKLPGITCALVVQYAISGQVNTLAEPLDRLCASLGFPASELCVSAAAMLCSHALWVTMATRTLSRELRPFWPRQGGRWLAASWHSLWLYWALAGYAASLAVYKLADDLSAALLPALLPPGARAASRVLDGASLVGRLTDRTCGGPFAIALGALAPCLSAPIFEEVLYRAFLLTALSAYVPVQLAVPLQGLLFGAHHLEPHALLPLASLGSLWAVLYLRSRNLLVCVLIHLLWNSRAFLCAFGWG